MSMLKMVVVLNIPVDAVTDKPTGCASEWRRPGHHIASGKPLNRSSPDLAHPERGVDQ